MPRDLPWTQRKLPVILAVLGILVLLLSCEPPALGSGQGGHLQEATGKTEEWRVDDSTTVTWPAGPGILTSSPRASPPLPGLLLAAEQRRRVSGLTWVTSPSPLGLLLCPDLQPGRLPQSHSRPRSQVPSLPPSAGSPACRSPALHVGLSYTQPPTDGGPWFASALS